MLLFGRAPINAALWPHCQAWQTHLPLQISCLRCQQFVAREQTAERFAQTLLTSRRSRRHCQPSRYSHRPRAQSEKASVRSSKDAGKEEHSSGAAAAPYILGVGIALLLGAGFVFKGQIRTWLDYFIRTVDQYGPLGYVAYGLLYVLLEILAVPAIPLTMTAGVIFGIVPGTIVVSAASVTAAAIAFLIARYAARDKVKELAADNAQFKVVDRAIGKNSFKIVTLLRLSPLLPLALSNYFYGLTSVDLGSYIVASWIGMLPGTIAYVTAGSYGRTVVDEGQGELPLEWWQVALGAGATVLALGYLGKIAKNALDEAEQEAESDAL